MTPRLTDASVWTHATESDPPIAHQLRVTYSYQTPRHARLHHARGLEGDGESSLCLNMYGSHY